MNGFRIVKYYYDTTPFTECSRTMYQVKSSSDRVLEERQKEDSLYESIISYDFYLPMDWEISESILNKYVDSNTMKDPDKKTFRRLSKL